MKVDLRKSLRWLYICSSLWFIRWVCNPLCL